MELSHIDIDCVPAIEIPGSDYIWVGDRKDDAWIKSSPQLHHTALTKANQLCDGWAVPAIKLLKAWNRSLPATAQVRSFVIETIAVTAFTAAPQKTLQDCVLGFFDFVVQFRSDFLQIGNLSDPAMEEELHERPLYRRFVGLDGAARLPDESTILRFRHLLEKHQLAPQVLGTINAGLAHQGLLLKTGTVVDATIIAAPSSTKNSSGERDPEMHQTKKGNQWHFGMKAHIGVDADSGLVHSVVGTAANVNDVTQAGALVHGEESDVFADAGYQGVAKREETQGIEANWHVAMRPGKRKALDKSTPMGEIMDKLEQAKARIRAKVEHPFRVIKQQFGHAKVRYRGLAKNTARLTMLFALSNLWMVRKRLLNIERG